MKSSSSNEHRGGGGCEGHDWNICKAIAESSKTSVFLPKVMSPFLRRNDVMSNDCNHKAHGNAMCLEKESTGDLSDRGILTSSTTNRLILPFSYKCLSKLIKSLVQSLSGVT